MKFEELIKEFSERLNIELPPRREDSSYQFFIDNRYTVTCLPASGNTFIITAELTDLPQDEIAKKEFLSDILKVNLARMYIQNEILSIDPETKKIILFNRISLDNLDVNHFISFFEQFLNTLEFWINYTTTKKEKSPGPENMIVFFP